MTRKRKPGLHPITKMIRLAKEPVPLRLILTPPEIYNAQREAERACFDIRGMEAQPGWSTNIVTILSGPCQCGTKERVRRHAHLVEPVSVKTDAGPVDFWEALGCLLHWVLFHPWGARRPAAQPVSPRVHHCEETYHVRTVCPRCVLLGYLRRRCRQHGIKPPYGAYADICRQRYELYHLEEGQYADVTF
jgi:hypothetical protein